MKTSRKPMKQYQAGKMNPDHQPDTPMDRRIYIYIYTVKLLTGLSGRGSFNNRSPRMSLQYLASLYCCPLQQWFSNDSMTGKSDVTKAVSRRA
jgi:hypothetical protein